MSNEEFKKWADANLAWDEQKGQWRGDDIALSAWQARQPEIDALETENRRLSDSLEAIDLDTKILVDEIAALKADNDRLEDNLDTLGRELTETEEENGHLETELVRLRSEVERLRGLMPMTHTGRLPTGSLVPACLLDATMKEAK